MPHYIVRLYETSAYDVPVEAATEEEARDVALATYHAENLVMSDIEVTWTEEVTP